MPTPPNVNTSSYALITNRGCVPALILEAKELGINAIAKGNDWAEAKLTSEALKIIHIRSQTVNRVLALIGVASDEEALLTLANSARPSGSFAVRAKAEESQYLQELVGGAVHDISGAPVNLSKPDTLLFIHETDGEFIFGTDLFGDIGKRHYKIMTGAHSLAGPIAASALRLLSWNSKKDLVVWPAGTGELAIEAALWACEKSPRAYELGEKSEQDTKTYIIAADPNLSLVRSCEKNAKVAGVQHRIKFSRQDLDWLDTKYDEHEISYLIGLLPNLKFYPKFTGELFFQLDYILDKGGIAGFLCINDDTADILERATPESEYSLRREYLWAGKQSIIFVVLERNTKRKNKKITD